MGPLLCGCPVSGDDGVKQLYSCAKMFTLRVLQDTSCDTVIVQVTLITATAHTFCSFGR